MEDSIEASIAVFFGLQGIPNALEDPQNPKVRYSEPQLRFPVLSERYCSPLPALSNKLTFLYEFHSLPMLIAHTSITRLQTSDS